MCFVVARRAQKLPEEAKRVGDKRVGDVKSLVSGTKSLLILFWEANMCWQWALMLCTRKNGLGVSFFLMDKKWVKKMVGDQFGVPWFPGCSSFIPTHHGAGEIYLVIPMGQLRGILIHKGDYEYLLKHAFITILFFPSILAGVIHVGQSDQCVFLVASSVRSRTWNASEQSDEQMACFSDLEFASVAVGCY